MDRWKDRAMGAAPVLIMLAAIGVDYGWQPDGTTSTRGDNIEYIVQISPEHLGQLQSIGEITSTVDPAIQDRVSRIVVKVGTGPLPRDSGRSTPVETSSSGEHGRTARTSPSDEQTVPIPEIAKSVAQLANPASASMMKPDPQGANFQMPGGPQTAAQNALDQVRNRAAEIANPLEANGNGLRTNQGPSTDPAVEREDRRWADLSAGNPTATTNSNGSSFTGGPSTDPVPPGARSTDWSRFVGPPRPTDPQSLSNPLATNPTNPYNPAANPATNTRNPADPAWTGYGTSPNFGSVPTASNSPSTGFGSTYQSTNTQTASGLITPRAAVPPIVSAANGYTRDSLTNIYNRDNQLVDSDGYPIDPKDAKYQGTNGQLTDRYNNMYDLQGNLVDRYGSRIDKNGRLLGANGSHLATGQSSPPIDSRLASTAPSNIHLNANDYNASPNYGSTPFTAAQVDQQRLLAQQQADLDLTNRLQRSQIRNQSAANTRLVNYDEEARSPSDLGTRNSPYLTNEQQQAAIAKNIKAQPLFNFVLLISLVGNAYLIFETNNLRRKFRNVISTLRSAKVTAQPVS